jgi:hypothetical protein
LYTINYIKENKHGNLASTQGFGEKGHLSSSLARNNKYSVGLKLTWIDRLDLSLGIKVSLQTSGHMDQLAIN